MISFRACSNIPLLQDVLSQFYNSHVQDKYNNFFYMYNTDTLVMSTTLVSNCSIFKI